MKLKILNTREIKKIREIVIRDFGVWFEGDYAFLKNERNRLFMVNKDISKLNLDNLRIDRMGVYIAEISDNQVRLSKSGVQLLGKFGELKHEVSLKKEEVSLYFKGQDLEKDLGEESKLVVLKYQGVILGCARYKEGNVLNFLPKVHRSNVVLL